MKIPTPVNLVELVKSDLRIKLAHHQAVRHALARIERFMSESVVHNVHKEVALIAHSVTTNFVVPE